jgi:hypothetical protein
VRLPGRAALQVLAQPAAPLVVGGNGAPAADGLTIFDDVPLLLFAAAFCVLKHWTAVRSGTANTARKRGLA